MPRISPYKIILTDEEQSYLNSIARKYTAPYRDVIRAQVILLAAEGFENKEIGEKLNLLRILVYPAPHYDSIRHLVMILSGTL
ncbi:hypothetical protein ACFL60_05870 [Candidatus Omnitrophota bacterium]